MTPPPLDTSILVVTPENVAFDFRLAGPFPRALALVLDTIVMGILLTALAFGLFQIFGVSGIGLTLFLAFGIWWGYAALFETWNNGQTPGKMAVGLRVVSHTGLAINGQQAVLRAILRSADAVPPFFPGLISMLCNSKFQRLGDLAAGTIVIVDHRQRAPETPGIEEDLSELRELLPPRFQAAPELVEALTAYVGRRDRLSFGRRHEMAQGLASHFIRVWSLPEDVDPDLLLCAVYETAVGAAPEEPRQQRPPRDRQAGTTRGRERISASANSKQPRRPGGVEARRRPT